MGIQNFISGLFACCRGCCMLHNQLETVELNTNGLKTVEIMVSNIYCPCKGCERKVKNSVRNMEGVTHVEVDLEQCKLSVTGYVDAEDVLKRVRRRTRKEAELWSLVEEPYVPYFYAPEPYDVVATHALTDHTQASKPAYTSFFEEVNYAAAINDENANIACTIM